jgi:hypothetical protein
MKNVIQRGFLLENALLRSLPVIAESAARLIERRHVFNGQMSGRHARPALNMRAASAFWTGGESTWKQ